MTELKFKIEQAWDDRSLLKNSEIISAIQQVIDLLDKGDLRVAEPMPNGWQVNEWVKKLLCFIFLFKKWKP